MTASSVLFLPAATLVATIVVARLVRTRSDWLRFVVLLVGAVAYTAALSSLVGSLISPHLGTQAGDAPAYAAKMLYAAWWLLLARLAIGCGRLLLRIDRSRRAMHLASDFVAVAVYLGAGLAILDLVFGISVTGLLATSGIIAIVLGLALQSTLGDLFSGVAIGIDRPFKVGDAISVEGVVDGRVVEASWRSLRLSTAAGAIATVPNSTVAKARILNRTSPFDSQNSSVRLLIDPLADQLAVVATLEAASLTASTRANSKPVVLCIELKGEGTLFQIAFSSPVADADATRSRLLLHAARHLRHAGIALAPHDGSAIGRRPPPSLAERLREVALFGMLDEEEIANLAAGIVAHDGKEGTTIFIQGGDVTSLFVLVRGAFEIERDEGGGPRRLGTLGPGDYFGELALLTGIANPATVRALTPYRALEIRKDVLSPLLARNPDHSGVFEEAAAQAGNLLEHTIAEASLPSSAEVPLRQRIARYFKLQG